MNRSFLTLLLIFITQFSIAGGLSAWYDVKTPHNNELECNGGYDVTFRYSYDLYKQLGDSANIHFSYNFREFAFSGDYLIAKGLIDTDSVYYIINEVNPEAFEFNNEKDFKIALQKMNIDEPWSWSWNKADYGMGWGMSLIFVFMIVFAIVCVIFILIIGKIISATILYFYQKNKN